MVLALSMSLPAAAAHPFTEETIPAHGSNPPAGVAQVIAYYSEPVDIAFSQLRVLDGSGNQVDNGDTSYHEGESSLVVTVPPLEDGVYTVSSKVLSKVDGHLVPDAFLFAVGDAAVDPELLEREAGELVFLPEAGARFPGLVGQSVALGAIIASLAVWGLRGPGLAGVLRPAEGAHRSRLMSLTGAGLVLVFASDMLMIIVHVARLGAPLADAVATDFGTVWIARLAITAAMLGAWVALDRRPLTRRSQLPLLASGLALIATTSLIGHGAASGQPGALALDYLHNLVAAAWIGGIAYAALVLVPAVSKLEGGRDAACRALVPRLTAVFAASLGAAMVSGPALLWLLESDLGRIAASTYGQLIMLKIALAASMAALGLALQLRARSPRPGLHRLMSRSLRADVALGVALLGVVALLVNGTLPAGQVQQASASAPYGLEITEVTPGARLDISIEPFARGPNEIRVAASGPDGAPLHDAGAIRAKVSSPARGVPPIEVAMSPAGDGSYSGEATFGFSGEWQLEVEAQRTESPSESAVLGLLVKPRLADLRAQIAEYELPAESKPLHPVYHAGSVWISDPSAPRVWEFSPEAGEFSEHAFEGSASTFLAAGPDGTIWFTDTPASRLGALDPATGGITTVAIPEMGALTSRNVPISVAAGPDGRVWVALVNKDRIAAYDPGTGGFEEVRLGPGSLPFALAPGPDGRIWYTASGSGAFGYIDPDAMGAVEAGAGLAGPEALLFDGRGSLERVPVPNPDALPFGMALGPHGNVWFAEHTADYLGVYDPDAGELDEVPIPGEGTFVQFLASDGAGGVWLVGQESNRLGLVQVTEVPPSPAAAQAPLRYSEAASPLMAAAAAASALVFARAVREGREADTALGGAPGRPVRGPIVDIRSSTWGKKRKTDDG